METKSDDSCVNNCSLFDFMANTIGIKVLHPGGYDATEQLCSKINLNENSHVLDLACGAGTTTFYLSKKYNCTIRGIDISSSLIDKANGDLLRFRNNNKIKFDIADALALPYPDNSFDFVVSQAFFILINDKKKALKEIYRVLKPGGHLGSLELGWLKMPPKNAYDEILDKTCTNFVPRMVEFNKWETFFKSNKFTLLGTTTRPMTSGMTQMLKIEGLLNFIKIMTVMATQPETRQRMMAVQKTFKKYDDYFAYGLFTLKK